ncbi:zinc ABC transporter substrate-binding protein [Aeromicrobium sp. IC_218]|uniref:metal ABC transporter substrate-binding protein n=1 Tax=Aeromicrobium sp. IC_218 TaxID=2545468 RepID=UPI00103AA892|nr:zinc ABC transporter substrate-binding protein [Aeromicrobium sp. IC_218]TCJ00337.1 zinc ABC transporter substrate-binding protein [Aeromicrobium sp. IC_218]
MRRSPLLAVPALALVLTACGGSGSDDSGKPEVVAAFYPYAWAAEQVGGDLVDISSLTSPGVEAHDLELTAKQVASVQDADVVIYQRQFQAAVDDAVERAGRDEGTTLDVAETVEMLDAPEGAHTHSHEEEGHDHAEGEDEHAHEEEGHEGHDHDHGDTDPHLWLDPTNMEKVVAAVADQLAEVDPDHADEYAANAEAVTGQLADLDRTFSTTLAKCERRTFVTSHAAFAYLAHKYDLEQISIAGIDPSNEPSAAQLAAISDEVNEEGVTTIFTERLVSPAVAETVARQTGATTAVLDPLEGLSDETSQETYLTIMDANLDALATANGCA